MAKGTHPQRFRAVLEVGPLGWTIARVPFDPAQLWLGRIRQRVRGEVNGIAFRSSLFPVAGAQGTFFLLINRTLQAQAKISAGAKAAFTVEPDMEERPAELPEELDALLDEAEGLRAFYNSFTEYARREMGKWIAGVKSPEARLRRAGEIAERLLATLEARTELPPLVERAFRARPGARAGWQRLTETQRRGELFALFGYKSPESQAKRLAKLCDLAESKAAAD